MKAIVNGRIVAPHAVIRGKVLLYDEKVAGIVEPGETPEGVDLIDAKGHYVIPGLVDMHIHGYLGEDASDGSYEGLRTMARGVARNGVTSFLPTTMTVSYEELRQAFAQIRRAMEESRLANWDGAAVVGANAEDRLSTSPRRARRRANTSSPATRRF